MTMRYNLIQLPEFVRIAWVSHEAQTVWEPRIKKISELFPVLERLAVLHDVKPSALQVCTPAELVTVTNWSIANGLVCIPLSMQGAGGTYASATPALEPGRPWAYRVFIGSADLAKYFIEWWNERDDERIGAALGFPSCCREFFQWAWNEQGWRDTTLPMSINPHVEQGARAAIAGDGLYDQHIRVGGSLECNVLLRWLGLRLVSHLPCSFYCDHSQKIGEAMGILGVRYGNVEEMDWLTQILSWPIRWSSLHGVAIITTPVFKLVVDTVPLKRKVIVDRDGPVYPTEGARGTEFPFRNYQFMKLMRPDDFTSNGFNSRAAMLDGHTTIKTLVNEFYMDYDYEAPGMERIIDLGCGNGVLLQSILNEHPDLKICGVESDPKRFEEACNRLDGRTHHFQLTDIYDEKYWEGLYGLAIISHNRLKEVKDESKVRALLNRIATYCYGIIIYSYDGANWPGCPYAADYFDLIRTSEGKNSCAILAIPRGEDD